MRDSEIVALLVAQDRAGLEAAYDAYADRLHDYARSMLRNAGPDAAADVTHDTFLIAWGKAADLRDPERLRPWLYAIARNECLRVLRQAKRSRPTEADHLTTLSDDDHERSSAMADPTAGLATADVAELVNAAANALAPKDREVYDLGLRHHLAAPEIAAALGVSDNAAHAMVSRVKTSLQRALGALLVARHRDCAELDAVLKGWDGTFDPLWRKRIARHVEGCEACSRTQERELSPAALLAIAPLAAAPAALRGRLVSASYDEPRVARAVRDAAPYRADGFPGADPRRRRGLIGWVAAGVFLLGGLGTVTALVLEESGDDDVLFATTETPSSPQPTPTPPAAQATQSTETLQPTRSPKPTPTGSQTTPTASPTTSLTPSPTAEPTTPTRTPTREPTRTPTTAPPTTEPTPDGRLVVTPPSGQTTPGGTVTVRVTAVDGPVDWRSSVSSTATPGAVSVVPASGSLGEGETVSVTISVGRTPAGNQVMVTFNPGGQGVQIFVV